MSTESENKFLLKAKQEIQHKIKLETQSIDKVKTEKVELTNAKRGYENFLNDLDHFILESMQDFSVTEEDLPKYMKSNLGEIYQNYLQVKKDTYTESEKLKKYIEHCKREVGNNKRSLKFYKSQYMDSDFFDDCLPLINLYEEKIDLYNENQKLTQDVIDELSKIAKKLELWN